MKKQILLFYFIFSVISFYSQNKIDSTNSENLTNGYKENTSIEITELDRSENNETATVDNTKWENKMPWIVALLIGLLSVISNYIVANQLRKTTKENLHVQFNATIASQNRQDWINELRHTLTEFLSSALFLSTIDENTIDEHNKYLEKLILSKSKIELLVNHSKPEQQELLNSVEKMLTLIRKNRKDEEFDEKLRKSRNHTIKIARNLFDIHWKKIKNLK